MSKKKVEFLDIEDMEYDQLMDYFSGRALIAIGRGESMKHILWETCNMLLNWKNKHK